MNLKNKQTNTAANIHIVQISGHSININIYIFLVCLMFCKVKTSNIQEIYINLYINTVANNLYIMSLEFY